MSLGKQGHERIKARQDPRSLVIGRERIGAHTILSSGDEPGERRSVTDCLLTAGREIRELW